MASGRWSTRNPEWHPAGFGDEVACFALKTDAEQRCPFWGYEACASRLAKRAGFHAITPQTELPRGRRVAIVDFSARAADRDEEVSGTAVYEACAPPQIASTRPRTAAGITSERLEAVAI